ncbi:MAG: IclR family transcriptional regulator [Hamadaea sp.]|uniref:IclR family transcriptional regulator n=1 Tax=Hamadaea sp. TaxID=2024425 RepID=UPI0017A7F05C|nr:IclR family transcriptional regulator [Hamadaea sp.]NUT19948.1 IclR family transcriptional regulator [Hamadaea sp.]
MTALDKAFDVLESLAEHERVTGIATATGLPKSTVHRILQALVERGFARSDGNGGYLPGPRIFTLTGKVTHRFDPARQAGPALARLRDATGHTVHFALRTGDEAVYIAKLLGLRPYQMTSQVGMSIPLHSTAIGKAILATQTDSEITAFCGRRGLPGRTPNTRTTPDALLSDLADVRRQGYAIDDEENEAGIVCVGAAVADHAGQIVGGISVSTLRHELSDAHLYGPAVVAAAREVSQSLGAP